MLVCDAAIFTAAELKQLTEMTVGEWDRMQAVNVRGVWMYSKAAVPQRIVQGGGKIIAIGSGSGLHGFPLFLHYDAS